MKNTKGFILSILTLYSTLNFIFNNNLWAKENHKITKGSSLKDEKKVHIHEDHEGSRSHINHGDHDHKANDEHKIKLKYKEDHKVHITQDVNESDSTGQIEHKAELKSSQIHDNHEEKLMQAGGVKEHGDDKSSLNGQSDHDHEHDEEHDVIHHHHEAHKIDEKDSEHDHASVKAIGKNKAIIEVDEAKGFKLSIEAFNLLKIETSPLNKNQIAIPKAALVTINFKHAIYVFREGYFKLIPLNIINVNKDSYFVHIKEWKKSDQLVYSGVELLRVADIYSQDKSAYGHSH